MFSKLIFSVPSKYLSSVSQAYSLEIIHFKKKWIPPCFPLRWYSFICWLYHQRSRVGPQQGAFWPPSLTAIEAIFGSEAKKKLYSFFQRMKRCHSHSKACASSDCSCWWACFIGTLWDRAKFSWVGHSCAAQDFPVGQCRRLEFNSWVGKIPWWKRWQPILVLLPGRSHGQRSLLGYSPSGRKEFHTALTEEACRCCLLSRSECRHSISACCHHLESALGHRAEMSGAAIFHETL